MVDRRVKAREPLEADSRLRIVGRVSVLSVYERPVSNPREIEPTNFSVETVLVAIV